MLKKVLFLEQINPKFKTMTGSKQSSGLSICVSKIASQLPDSIHMRVDNVEQSEMLIQRFKPKMVIFEALGLLSSASAESLRRKYPKTKFYTHIHSNIPFFSEEGFGFHKINEHMKAGFKIIFNSIHAHQAIDNSIYLPNIYTFENMHQKDLSDQHLDIACPGSVRTMKNHSIQLLAARQIAKDLGKNLRFHVNFGRVEGPDSGRLSVEGINQTYEDFELIKMPWLEHNDFLNYLTNMHLGMQISLSESFNLVAADMVTAGIPMVVSDSIDWTSKDCRAATNNFRDIVETAKFNLRSPWVLEENRRNLRAYSDSAIKVWSHFVETSGT